LYIEVGNKGGSYGPGALDLTKRLVFAKPNELENDDERENLDESENNNERDLETDWNNENEEVLVQCAWFRDDELLNTISIYGLNSIIICYNSHLKRTIFSMPENPNFAAAKESDARIPLQQKKAVLNIGRNRIMRNVGISITAAAGIYALKTLLWPVIIGSQLAHYVMGLVNSSPTSATPPQAPFPPEQTSATPPQAPLPPEQTSIPE
jgi:hypothetical protein